ncbi:MAG: ribulose-phosphate 3-epimerase [Ignavibacteriales bacterium]|nr:ribulose-phosphate 3-epimerase [Ignavibacteriales bacterium]
MKLVAPSILSADLANLGEQIKLVERAGADWIHVDAMDGRFVPNLTFGPPVVAAAKRSTKLPVDVHLMIVEPDALARRFVEAGADVLTVHQEEVVHLHRSLQNIKALGAKAGVAVNPATPVSTLREIANDMDLLLVMSVNPGFGGQSFVDFSLRKIEEAATLREREGADYLIEVDGGVDLETIRSVRDAGADVFVAGSAIFKSEDPEAIIKTFKEILSE